MSRKKCYDVSILNELIINKAVNLGCKPSGDFVWFDKKFYYVRIEDGTVTEQLLTKQFNFEGGYEIRE